MPYPQRAGDLIASAPKTGADLNGAICRCYDQSVSEPGARLRKLLYAAAFLRALAIGMMAVLIGLYCARLGFDAAQIGIVLSAALWGAAAATLFTMLVGQRCSERSLLVSLCALPVVGCLILVSNTAFAVIVAAAFFGMASLARELAERRIATLRFQFPYMQKGLKRPDPAAVAQAAVRAAVIEAARRLPDVPLFAGGKSFGGRMTSQAHAKEPLPKVVGLAFVGFPLHRAGKPSIKRADHLAAVQTPMLFLQGTRDALADYELVKMVIARLGEGATLATFDDADHSFHLRGGRGTKSDLIPALAETMSAWMQNRR